jgi:predicted kinase
VQNLAKAIILIGIQGSGKSTFYRERLSEYVHVNLDTLHTRNKERLLIEECLENGQTFVVDNTNPTKADREKYISAAKEKKYQIEGYFLQSILADCIERNKGRSGKACVPDKAIVCTSNRLEMPSYQEGFDKLYFVKIEHGEFVVEEWKAL